MAADDGLLTADEVALQLRLHPDTVRRLVAAGALAGVQVSQRRMRIRPESLDRLVEHGYHVGGDAA
jgi:excisionase family DNA binding protein